MSRRSKRKHQASPSLFPFLAVLICTMGAIIVLLVLVVKNADVQADVATQANQDELDEKKQELKDQLELESSQVATLKELRPDLKERLEKEKTVFGHLSDHVSRLKKELDQLKSDYSRVAGLVPAENDAQVVDAEIEDLKKKIELAKSEFVSKKKEVNDRKPAYAIIPHAKGGNGTFRRPIFVECDGQGVTLQPYGITLRSADFPKSMGPNNPLDTALLMIRDYWNQIDPNQTNGQPYPLFVVRPSGSKAFAAARKAMKSWVDEFGYELVTADIELKYPDVDENFSNRLKQSVEIARAKQQNVIAAINRQKVLGQIRRLENQRDGAQGYRASSLTGGFVQEGTGQSAGQARTNPNTRFASAARSNENQFSGSGNGSTRNSSSQNQFAPTNGQTSRGASTSRSSSFQPFGGQPQNSGSRPATRNGFNNTANGIAGQSGGGTQAQGSQAQGSQAQGSQAQGSQAHGSPSQGAPSNPSQALPPESLALSRGSDWALPSKANNSIQVRKPIKVQINRNEIQIVELGKGIKSIPFGKNTAGAVPGLIEQVWKHIDAWGIAGVNSYWKPTLNMYVAPDAQSRFFDLQILLSGSGLDLRRAE